MRKNKKAPFLPLSVFSLCALAALLLVQGCGGGGDNSGPAPAPVNPNMRTLKAGDSIKYHLLITDLASGDQLEGPAQLDFFETVTNPDGIPCTAYRVTANMASTSGALPFLEQRALIYQDPAGNLYACGKYSPYLDQYIFIKDTSDTPKGLALWIKNPVAIGNNLSHFTLYTDNTWDNCTLEIMRTDTVRTAKGAFEAFEMTENCTFSDAPATSVTNWLYPPVYFIRSLGTAGNSQVAYDLTGYSLQP